MKKKASVHSTSIIILCHNDGNYLKQCLRSVFRYTRLPFEVILVENGSTDGSDRVVRQFSKRSNVKTIYNRQNRYFSGGNNQGILKASGNYIVLLNADAVVGPEWLSRLIRCAESDPEIGIVAPYSNHAVGEQLVKHPGYRLMGEFPAFSRKWSQKYNGQSKEIHRLICFCVLIKREVLGRVGLLDERFGPGGYEDYDYCLRTQQAGFKLVLAQDVFVHHHGGKGYVGMDYDHYRDINREVLARKWSLNIFRVLDSIDSLAKEK